METFKKTNNEKCVLKAKKKIECLADSSKSREERVEECVRFYEKYKYILEPENRDSFFYVTFNDCKIILILVLRHYIGRSKISIPFYYEEPTEERYKQINCILKGIHLEKMYTKYSLLKLFNITIKTMSNIQSKLLSHIILSVIT